jgi:hypothetical protein
MQVDKFIDDVSQTLGQRPMAQFGMITLQNNRSIRSYNIRNGDTISLSVTSRTKKPIIYLYSPSDIDVSVKLSLIPEWSLSVIYPVVTIEDHGQRLEWNVRTHQDGSLTEHNSGLDVSYLFWEAELVPRWYMIYSSNFISLFAGQIWRHFPFHQHPNRYQWIHSIQYPAASMIWIRLSFQWAKLPFTLINRSRFWDFTPKLEHHS